MPVCSQCGTENPEGFRFCGACGAPLETLAAAERRERRIVTMLFADLAGFTRRSETLGCRGCGGVPRSVFRGPARGGRAHGWVGGEVHRRRRDGVVWCDRQRARTIPERAVRCGLASASASVGLGTGLHVRVGITTGEALMTLPADGHPDAIGDVVNTAARLEAAAPTDRVLVDEWTYQCHQPGYSLRGGRAGRRERQGHAGGCVGSGGSGVGGSRAAARPAAVGRPRGRVRHVASGVGSIAAGAIHAAGLGDRRAGNRQVAAGGRALRPCGASSPN